VRIELDSTTSDVISLRARPIGRKRPRIGYTLVDEYETEYKIRPVRTARPLTLGQLITLLFDVDTDITEREWLRHGWVLSLNESSHGSTIPRSHGPKLPASNGPRNQGADVTWAV